MARAVSKYAAVEKKIYVFEDAINRTIPTKWLRFFLRVADAGDNGITIKKVYDSIGMTQSTGSRVLRLLGYLFIGTPELHGIRLRLSEQGKRLAAAVFEE